MDERSTETVISSLLHDTGKVIYREGTDRRKHSISGYEFLKKIYWKVLSITMQMLLKAQILMTILLLILYV